MCVGHMMYMKHMKFGRGFFLTPSTAAGGPPPSKREVWGFRRSRPAALPSIAYRGFAVAPMTLRAPARNLVYNSGCRVATLLVSKGVMGFLGDLRGRNSKSPPNPLGLAERVHRRSGGRSKQTVEGVSAQCLPIIYPFISICDSNKYIKTIVNPCFSKNIICLMCVGHMKHMKHMKFTP